MDHQQFRAVTAEDLDKLIQIRDINTFIEQSYRKIFDRNPDLRGAIRYALILRFLPFASMRRKFLQRLLRSEECWRLQDRRFRESSRELDQRRLALNKVQRGLEGERNVLHEQERQRELHNLEQSTRIEGLLQRSLEPLRPIAGEHSRLLEQHSQLLEQHSQLLEQHSQLLEQQQQFLGQQHESHERLAACLELLSQLPGQLGQLLEQHQHAVKQGATEYNQRSARTEGRQREFFGELRQVDLVPIDSTRPSVGLDDPQFDEVGHFVEDAFRLILKRPPESLELAEGSERLRGAVARVKGEFLQELLGQQPGSASQLPQPARVDRTPAATSPEQLAKRNDCRICGGGLSYKWSLRVLRGERIAHYYECNHCRALQVIDPMWLEEAYASEDRPLEANPDVGRFSRNFSAYNYFSALHEAGLVDEHPVVLDYGGGYGLLAQMLKSGGYEVWQADPYVPVPFLAAERSLRDLADFPDASFDLIFALEVVEHLADPLDVLGRLCSLLKPTGTLMLSTSLYYPGSHDHRWNYLATEWGQHITFWTHDALSHCAEQLGFRSIGYFPGNEGFFILLSKLSAEILKARLDEAQSNLKDPDHLRRITTPWDLQALGCVRVGDDIVVEPIAAIDAHPQERRGIA